MKPYLKAQTIRLGETQDRRRVLTDEQKQEMRELYAKGELGTRLLARRFGCSRSLVQLTVNENRAKYVRDRMKAHWRDYARKYGKEYHAASMRKTRNYKYKLYKEGQLKKNEEV